jgi:hypothetical protein
MSDDYVNMNAETEVERDVEVSGGIESPEVGNEKFPATEVNELDARSREVIIRKRDYTEVAVIEDSADDPAGATHEYMVYSAKNENENSKRVLGVISFQRGPIREFGVNGVQNEDLIAICIDRLQHFQKGPYACRENAIALTKLEEASMWLEKRTNDRKARGVEGTSIK